MVRPIVVAIVATGLLGSLVVLTLSGRWSHHSQGSKAQPQTIHRTPTLVPLSSFATVTPGHKLTSAAGAPPSDAAETSRQLQLEIQHAVASGDDDERWRAYTQLVPALIAIDPDAMKRIMENSPAGPRRQDLLHHTARAWSSTNITGAIQWVNGMGDDSERVMAAKEVVSQLGQSDPSQAIEVADVFGVGRDDGTVDHIAMLWAAQDMRSSLQWIEAQAPGAQRDRLLARINSLQAESAPVDAANTALSAMTPGPIQDDAVASVVRSWSSQDAEAASRWVGELPQGRLRELAKAALAHPN